jgi:beta-glucosidase/6-phospho-beta-glucosidase/beta-galactosidase
VWSAVDNSEQINGYGDRFGIVCVDFKTHKHTPKHGAHGSAGGAAQYPGVTRHERQIAK